MMIQIAHRGYSDKYGDNNMESFLEAMKIGFEMIELDIQECKTGEIVVFHDTYLESRPIRDYTLKELNEKNIVELISVFDILKTDSTIKLFLDIKGDSKVIYPLINMLRSNFSRKQLRRIYISSFNRLFIKPLLESNLPVRIGFTTENLYEKEELDYLTRNVYFVCLHWTVLNHENIEMLHKKGITVYSYTCKDEYILDYMMQYKLDGIVTNYFIEKIEQIG